MKTIFATALLALTCSAFASTYSQQIAGSMSAVLESESMQEILAQEDGMGNLKSITYSHSGRAAFGPDVFNVLMESNGIGGLQQCEISASVNTMSKRVILGKAKCTSEVRD